MLAVEKKMICQPCICPRTLKDKFYKLKLCISISKDKLAWFYVGQPIFIQESTFLNYLGYQEAILQYTGHLQPDAFW